MTTTQSPENFDEIAERITLESDRRIKKSVKKNGDCDYYLWFRTPFTKFRGFWGTLLVTYWLPAMLKRELVNNFSRNVGFPAIASVIDKLESRGEFIGGVRQQGMLRAKLA